LKSQGKLFAVMLFLVSSLPATRCPASTTTNLLLTLQISVWGQAADAKAEVDGLLSQARAAMKAGDLAKAEALITQAESKNVKYGLFDLGDTPNKARRDLEKLRRGNPSSSRGFPSFGLGGGNKKPTVDPFAQRGSQPGAPQQDAQNPHPQNPRAASDRALLTARTYLAVGDLSKAQQELARARSLGIEYGVGEDSPAKVEAAIRKYQDVINQQQGRQRSEAWRRQYAEALMEQAEALLGWGRLDEAERLATDAANQGVRYTQFEPNPAALLQKIARARKQGPQTRAAGRPGSNSAAKNQALALVQQGRAALSAGDLVRSGRLAAQAHGLGVAQAEFAPGEDSPAQLLADIREAQQNQIIPAGGAIAAPGGVKPSVYHQNQDNTSNRQATAVVPGGGSRLAQRTTPGDAPPPATVVTDEPAQDSEPGALPTANNSGRELFEEGERALSSGDSARALRYFRAAYAHREELDPATQQQLQDHLQLLSSGAGLPAGSLSLAENAAARQQLMARELASNVAKIQLEARRLRESNPDEARKVLEEMKEKVKSSEVAPATRSQLLRRLDISLGTLERFVNANRTQIELNRQNKEVLAENDRIREARLDKQQKIADYVEEYNKLVDEYRFAEAQVIAKRARELAPDEPVVVQLWQNAKFLMRFQNNEALREQKEQGFFDTMMAVEESGVPFDDRFPINYGDARAWEELSRSRLERLQRGQSRLSEREMEIQRKLKMPVSLRFNDSPLGEVMDHLARLTGVNIHLDPRGLAEEGVTTNTPVSISLANEISLQSALNLILEPLHLSYVIKDEVLKITSEQLKDGEVYTVTYNVADLVVPIPNFVPGSRLGLSGLIQDAYSAIGYGGATTAGAPLSVVASNSGAAGSAMINPNVLSQMMGPGVGSGPVAGGVAGPGSLGGAAEADFDALIELITTTIQPNTWDEVGGPGSIKEFETNLSLVISQTQDVHDEIVDLLEQLRRLQDLQVTIEVRFIRLDDDFFERIGVDFDFALEDDTGQTAANLFNPATDIKNPSLTVGFQGGQNQDGMGNPIGGFTADLDIPFVQGGFPAATPTLPFAAGNINSGAMFGFAILSDIEAFFLVSAAQGDQRSNVLQAPKVTLFNGQQAFVSDTAQTPFVISVIPVVGDFAAAQQPVIVVLSEGTFLNIQAVVSNDRRYVRLTVVPFFSQIGEVEEFTFEGSSSQSASESEERTADDDDSPVNTSNQSSTVRQGTTVQLPTFIFVTVTTTVSVPDGGTVLLGGIKRLTETRSEFGIPLLSKVPYINRLFRNVGIAREAESLMMMVTPRIIIQEEEEERLGIDTE